MALRWLKVVFLGTLITSGFAQEYNFSINWVNDQARSISIVNLETSELKVKLENSDTFIIGKTVQEDSHLTFIPAIPFSLDLTYEAFIEGKRLFAFTPQREVDNPRLLKVYPQTNQLPENFLKFYLVFDQPMAVGHVYEFLHLFHNNKEIERAFLPLQPELWDEERKVLTLWIEPGRIKKGLGPNREFGQVLAEGDEYEFIVDEGIKNLWGKPLLERQAKVFTAIKRDSSKPFLVDIDGSVPKVGSNDGLMIAFSEPMDYSVRYFVSITLNQRLIEGEIDFQSDSTFTYTPLKNWTSGSYELLVDVKSEDLAGNNFTRLFDEDLENPSKPDSRYKLIFTIK